MGADPEALDGDGQSLLHMMASWRDRDDSVAIDIMQKHKLDMGLLNHRKQTYDFFILVASLSFFFFPLFSAKLHYSFLDLCTCGSKP